MEVVAKVHLVSEENQVSASYKKRELVVKTDEQYPQFINIEFAQDKCDLLNGLSIGQEVKVSINLGGREWVNPEGVSKYFNSIKGWRIEKLSDAPTQTSQPVPTQQTFAPATNVTEEEQDDLPF